MANLTEKERIVLRAITLSEYHSFDSTDPRVVDFGVWSFSLNNFETAAAGIKGKALSGVVGSLVRKGFAGTSQDDGDDVVWITAAGWNELTAATPDATPDPASYFDAKVKGTKRDWTGDVTPADKCSRCGLPKMPSGYCSKCGNYDVVPVADRIQDATPEQLISAAFGKAFAAIEGRDDNRGRYEEMERILFGIYSRVGEQFKLAASIADLKTAAIGFNGSLERHSKAQAELSRYMRHGDLHDPKLLGVPSGSDYAAAIETARFAKDEMESAAAFIRAAFSRETLEYAIRLANDGKFPEFNTAIMKFAPLS